MPSSEQTKTPTNKFTQCERKGIGDRMVSATHSLQIFPVTLTFQSLPDGLECFARVLLQRHLSQVLSRLILKD